jgi:hypothetical protein
VEELRDGQWRNYMTDNALNWRNYVTADNWGFPVFHLQLT